MLEAVEAHPSATMFMVISRHLSSFRNFFNPACFSAWLTSLQMPGSRSGAPSLIGALVKVNTISFLSPNSSFLDQAVCLGLQLLVLPEVRPLANDLPQGVEQGRDLCRVDLSTIG